MDFYVFRHCETCNKTLSIIENAYAGRSNVKTGIRQRPRQRKRISDLNQDLFLLINSLPGALTVILQSDLFSSHNNCFCMLSNVSLQFLYSPGYLSPLSRTLMNCLVCSVNRSISTDLYIFSQNIKINFLPYLQTLCKKWLRCSEL